MKIFCDSDGTIKVFSRPSDVPTLQIGPGNEIYVQGKLAADDPDAAKILRAAVAG